MDIIETILLPILLLYIFTGIQIMKKKQKLKNMTRKTILLLSNISFNKKLDNIGKINNIYFVFRKMLKVGDNLVITLKPKNTEPISATSSNE